MSIRYFERLDNDITIGFSPLCDELNVAKLFNHKHIVPDLSSTGGELLSMRKCIVNWIRCTAGDLKLEDATVSNAVAIADECIAKGLLQPTVQSAGATALLISTKWHDDIDECVGADIISVIAGCNVYELLREERRILNAFDWSVERVTPHSYINNCVASSRIKILSSYIATLYAIMDSYMDEHPLNIAALSVYFAYRLLGISADDIAGASNISISASKDYLHHSYCELIAYQYKYEPKKKRLFRVKL